MRLRLPIGEEHGDEEADSRTKKAILTKRKGKMIPKTNTTGNRVRLDSHPRDAAAAVAATVAPLLPVPPLPPPPLGLDIVTLFIPVVDMYNFIILPSFYSTFSSLPFNPNKILSNIAAVQH